MKRMNLEPVIQSEVCQNEKNKYHILIQIHMESRRMVLMNLLQGRDRDTDTENRLVGTMREGKGRRIERVALKHTHNQM